MPGPTTILTAFGRPTVAYLADLTQHGFDARLTNEPEIDLRVPSGVLDRLAELEKHHLSRLPYVETTVAPRFIRVVDGVVTMQLGTSNYARFAAAMQMFGEYDLDEQRRLFTEFSIGTPPWFAHSLGVNCSLETSDGKLVWSHRPAWTVVEPDVFAPVMNEGSNFTDLRDHKWDPATVARRGFHEELGFAIERPEQLDITFHSLITQFGSGGAAVLGHAITSLTMQEVIEQHYDALDAKEHANGLFACEVNAESFLAFLRAHPVDQWATWGTAALWHLATHRLNVKIPGLELQPLHPAEQLTAS